MLSGWGFVHPVSLRYRDLDTFGHVNNAVYLSYLEAARIAWWLEVTGGEGLDALNMILARAEIDYRSPVVWGESLEIGVRCSSVGRTSLEIEMRIVEAGSGRLVADARKVCVLFDHAAGHKLEVPEALRARLQSSGPERAE